MPSSSLSAVEQCSETREYLNQKTVVKVSFIGQDNAISSLASVQKKGAAFSGLSSVVEHSVIDSSVTEKLQADRTKWNCTYTIYSPLSGSSGDAYYTTLDSMTMVQQQFPLYKYLNAEEAAAVVAWDEEDWNGERATEKKVKKSDYKYWDTGLETFRLLSEVSEKAESVAKKLLAGFEYVQKAYPQITHVEKFNSKKSLTNRQNKLNHIDNDGVPKLISGYSWLKVQFDWQQNDDGTWTLTESWMGVPSTDPWDPDLYGANAWTFFIPTTPAQNNNNNNNNNNS